MATSPEIERPSTLVTEIPDSPQVPPELEQGLKSIPNQHTNIPQVNDDPTQQIAAVPAPADPSGPSITLPADPQVFAKQAKGSSDDAQTWNAWFWLREIKKAISKHLTVMVGSNEQGSK